MALRASRVVAACLLLTTSAKCHYSTYDYGFDVSQHVKRQLEHPIVVGRLGPVNGTWPMRHEIRQFEKNQEQWTLYLLGLSLMQFMDQSDPLSWYEIAGIHGAPYQSWGGVEPTPKNKNSGYCHHASVLFPTWHRPYIALFENVLYSVIQFIASIWTDEKDRNRYEAAAATFRVPYWDWAITPPKRESVLPRSVWESSLIDVDGPNGVQRITNPLFAYAFKPLNPTALLMAPWDVFPNTFRAPTANDSTAQSNNTLVAMNLDRNLVTFQQRLYTLFSNYDNYTAFSTSGQGTEESSSSYDSLESLHDLIHSLSGGPKGHMAFVPFAGFDPLFYLHHAMVDRILAMWQALYPDSWVTPEPSDTGTYTIAPGEILDSKTALTPFYAHADGTFWDSDMVRDPRTFGYTYAEVAGLDLGGGIIDSQAQSSIKLAINRLYGSSSPSNLVKTGRGGAVEGDQAAGQEESDGANTPPESDPDRSVIVNNKYREWVANIRVKKHALGGTFFIHFFLDSVPEDAESWAHAPSLVGTMSVFATPGRFGTEPSDPDTTGTVPLTAALVREATAGTLPNLEPGAVQPYLEENLQFGIVGADGTVYDNEEVAGLHIGITSSSVKARLRDEELPTWGESVTHFDLV